MALETYIPQRPLSDFVQMLWYWEGYHPPHPKERILPGGMMEITINLSPAPFRICDARGKYDIGGPLVAGARSTFFVVETVQPMSILSVWFKPGGALPFFGVPGHELQNRHVPLEALWGRKARELHSRLYDARTTVDRFHVLERALLDQLLNAGERHRAVHYALNIFRTVPHQQSIHAVVEAIALSPPRFIQIFRDDVGMSPKQFCRVQRFQRALKLLATRKDLPLIEVALACGYYDQAHFTNDFRAFAGITPTAYAPQSSDHIMNLPFNDQS